MKATIIGSDLLEYNGDVKIIEINTNTTIYNSGAEMLEYDGLFQMLANNSISEFHFIWTESDAYLPLNEPYKFKEILQQKCVENNISFFEYSVPLKSVTVPFIEDADSKFILRQAFDTTALVDDTYCADKFEFFNLMSGSNYIPKTYFSSSNLSMDTFDSVNTSDLSHPNTLIKAKNPIYNTEQYPELYTLQTIADLEILKSTNDSSNLIQEFIFDDANLVQGRYSIIRGIDIVYGGELDVISLGGYRQSTVVPVTFSSDEYLTGTNKLNQKSRFKYITKEVGTKKSLDYHTDEQSNILDFTGSLQNVTDIKIGDYIRSIDFTDYNDNHAANLEQGKIDVIGWSGSLQQSNDTLTQLTSSLQSITSASVDTIYIRITTTDGKSWVDSPACTYYVEESGSLSTGFTNLNKLVVGDKLIVTDQTTQQLTTLEITGLEMEYANMTIYNLDFEPSDLFLVDFGDGDFGVMHNSCWCPWNYCGHWCNSNYCPNCDFQPVKV